MAVGFSFNQHHLASRLCRCETVQAIKAGLGSRFPAEAVTFKSNPKTNRQLLAVGAVIRNAHGGPMVVGKLGQAAAFKEVYGQRLRSRVLGESQSGRGGRNECCAVAPVVGG